LKVIVATMDKKGKSDDEISDRVQPLSKKILEYLNHNFRLTFLLQVKKVTKNPAATVKKLKIN